MKKIIYTLFLTIGLASMFVSCSQEETYAEQKERENNCINAFLEGNSNVAKKMFPEGIERISEAQFHEQGDVTYAPPASEKYQFVLFENSGVFMHIKNKGNGDILSHGQSMNIECRFTEYNINADAISMSNAVDPQNFDKIDLMGVSNNSGTYTASFLNGVMAYNNSNTEVPNGWLVPLPYIKLGRYVSSTESIAHVYVIVPHNQGHTKAKTNVYACLYDLTYQKPENE